MAAGCLEPSVVGSILSGREKGHFVVVGIPAHNEEHSIGNVVQSLLRLADIVVVCDDGSNDRTAQIAESSGAIVLRHASNMGYGASLSTIFGFARETGADILVTFDGDGQHQADDFARLVAPILGGEADIVIGSRFLGEVPVPLMRRLGIRIINAVVNGYTRLPLTDTQSGLRSYNRSAIQKIEISEPGMAASTEILIKAHLLGLRVKEAPANTVYLEKKSIMGTFWHGFSVLARTLAIMPLGLRTKALWALSALLTVPLLTFLVIPSARWISIPFAIALLGLLKKSQTAASFAAAGSGAGDKGGC